MKKKKKKLIQSKVFTREYRTQIERERWFGGKYYVLNE